MAQHGNEEPSMQVMVTCGDISGAVVTTLKDPQTSENRQYLIKKSPLEIYELQANNGNKYSSFFVDSNVISNGTFQIATPIDPLFILLPILSEVAVKWSPVDQLCMELPVQLDDDNDISKLEHLCESSDMLGDETLLYKFSESRAVTWLTKKHRLALDVVQRAMVKQKQAYTRNNASSLILDTAGDDYNNIDSGCQNSTTTLTKAEERKANQAAFQIVCEYINPTWRNKLSAALDLAIDTLVSNQLKRCSEKRGSAWDAEAVDDEMTGQMEQYIM
mmetsp:Transcript_11383/g.17254  ORF Transcript_11383/g.17254 Transcript_11383/m.17254 type:complete len:275 (-) Transcript_11383:271-1095(-)